LSLSAGIQDTHNKVALNVNFTVGNAVALLTRQNNTAFNNLTGQSGSPQSGASDMSTYFDWGLPFHFGRNVFTAIEDRATPGGTGPFVAF
jgi:hypothetical protein